MGGSQKGAVRTYINIMVVFIISGIWHGENYTFILWGIVHGIVQCINKAAKKQYDKLNPIIQWGITFLFLNVSWLLFRADSVGQWKQLCKKKFCFQIFG